MKCFWNDNVLCVVCLFLLLHSLEENGIICAGHKALIPNPEVKGLDAIDAIVVELALMEDAGAVHGRNATKPFTTHLKTLFGEIIQITQIGLKSPMSKRYVHCAARSSHKPLHSISLSLKINTSHFSFREIVIPKALVIYLRPPMYLILYEDYHIQLSQMMQQKLSIDLKP